MRLKHRTSPGLIIGLVGAVLLAQPASGRAQKKPGAPPPDPAIAYQKPVGGNINVMVMNADGSNQRAVYNRGQSYTPSWSPDGKKLVFANSGTSNGPGIYIINLDGTGLCKLAALNNTQPVWTTPVWSPEPVGSNYWIVYADYSGARRDLFAVKADCSNPGTPINLTNTPADEEWFPSWSRFANHIAVQLAPGGSTPEVAIYDVSVGNGTLQLSNQVKLTTLGLFLGTWTAAPDYGKGDDRIVLESTGDPGAWNDLWVTDLTQSGTYNLTHSADLLEQDSSWSPDGTAVVFYGLPVVSGQPTAPGAIYKLSYNATTGAWVRTMLLQYGNSSLYPKWRRCSPCGP